MENDNNVKIVSNPKDIEIQLCEFLKNTGFNWWDTISDTFVERFIDRFEMRNSLSVEFGSDAYNKITRELNIRTLKTFNEFKEYLECGFYSKDEILEILRSLKLNMMSLREIEKHSAEIGLEVFLELVRKIREKY